VRKLLIRAAIFVGGFGFIAGTTLFAFAYFTVSIPDANAFVNSQSTIIQYSNGEEIGRVGSENRQIVPLAKIPMNVRNAVLAAEDRSFYSNRAFSVTGIARAVINNLRGGSLQGGSTITQQYAKTAFLTPERTIQRKIKELVIAIKLENQHYLLWPRFIRCSNRFTAVLQSQRRSTHKCSSNCDFLYFAFPWVLRSFIFQRE
jgi:membrane peptidoglycan carboxypeptidase